MSEQVMPDRDRNSGDGLADRVLRLERGQSDMTRRIDVLAEKSATVEKAGQAVERAVDKLANVLESQREVRALRDEQVKERMDGLEKDLTDFIRETREGSKDLRAFGRQIGFLAIASALGAIGSLIVALVMRGVNA